jgi:hypothetical protein
MRYKLDENGNYQPDYKPNWFTAIMQLLGCVVGSILEIKTGDPMAFILVYLPCLAIGWTLQDL